MPTASATTGSRPTPRPAPRAAPGWAGRRACLAHVTTHTATLGVALAAVVAVTGLHLAPPAVVAGLTVNAASHYLADRRAPLAAIAAHLGKTGYWHLGGNVAAVDGAPAVHLGTGAAHLDQAWHHAWLLVTALIISAGA